MEVQFDYIRSKRGFKLHCHHDNCLYKKNGKPKGIQHYICDSKDCGITGKVVDEKFFLIKKPDGSYPVHQHENHELEIAYLRALSKLKDDVDTNPQTIEEVYRSNLSG
jgi:hypothetical protein